MLASMPTNEVANQADSTLQSYLCCDEDVARFNGTLDIQTLGGMLHGTSRATV